MPLNALKITRSTASLFLFLIFISAIISGQTTAEPPSQPRTLTPAEMMQARIAKAKAYIAVRNYAAATVELETIRRDSGDDSVNSVATVLLMNSYIEHGEYQRASQFLEKLFTSYKANNAFAQNYYTNAAGQIIKSTRSKIERYRQLGLSVSDRNMPLEAVSDLEKSRELLELLITQAKEMASDQAKLELAAPLLEEATDTRSSLARDEYDARRWRAEMADAREIMASARSVILSAIVDPNALVEPIGNTELQTAVIKEDLPSPVAVATPAAAANDAELNNSKNIPAVIISNESTKKPDDKPADAIIPEKLPEAALAKESETSNANEQAADTPATEIPVSNKANMGALLPYAVRRPQPTYPPAARTARITGNVRVDVVVNENGDVEEVLNINGNPMLQSAARDAIMKWKFRPLERNGQKMKMTGFINFNFSL